MAGFCFWSSFRPLFVVRGFLDSGRVSVLVGGARFPLAVLYLWVCRGWFRWLSAAPLYCLAFKMSLGGGSRISRCGTLLITGGSILASFIFILYNLRFLVPFNRSVEIRRFSSCCFASTAPVLLKAPFVRFSVDVLCLFLFVLCLLFLDWEGSDLTFLQWIVS